MRKGDYAELKMKKVLWTGGLLDDKLYICEVMHMKEEEESLYLLLKDGFLEEISLDAIYECKVRSADSEATFTGRMKERFIGQNGKSLKIQIENGFYKISIK